MAESKDDAAKASTAEPTAPSPAPATAAASTAAAVPAPTAESHESAPDPDVDDLDDLDDMLDEFSAKPAPPAATSAGVEPSASTGAQASSMPDIPPDFAAQLQKEMEALMGGIESNPDMQKQMEAMMAELAASDPQAAELVGAGADAATGTIPKATEAAPATTAATAAADKDKSKASGGGGGGEDAFSETIRKTMERMQASSTSASAAATSSATSEDDMMAALMKELAAGGGMGSGEAGDNSEEDFSKMLLGMMEQLTNKEILYEPMKDLDTRFPQWMKDHEGKVGEEDWKRYGEQRSIVRDIVARFEKKGYSDEDPKDREYIVERMQQMQALGSPPDDLVGDMKETQEALGDIDQGCAQQ